MNEANLERRRLLAAVLKLLLLLGLGLFSLPFILNLMSSLSGPVSEQQHWAFELTLDTLQPGQLQTYPWPSGELAVYRRTAADLEWLAKPAEHELADARSHNSDQPAEFSPILRSASDLYFVFIPVENYRHCQLRLGEEKSPVVFTEPCLGAHYDAAGRRFKNSGHEQQQNLAVPGHIIEAGKLKVAAWQAKITR